MNTITVDLSDQALADLHAIMITLRAKWRTSPGKVADHVVTESDAVRHALCVAAMERSVADLVPDDTGSKQ